jgi:hypothetical protein
MPIPTPAARTCAPARLARLCSAAAGRGRRARALLPLLALGLCAGDAAAQTKITHPIRLIVP